MTSIIPKYAIRAALSLALLGAPVHADALTLNEVDNKSDEELAAENWETRDVKASSGTARCGFLAILVSTVWRGYGHYCIGDNSSHYKLLGMEGASLGMLSMSMLIGSLTHDDSSMSAVWKSLFHFGTTLFIGSYLFDVFGAFKGDSFNLDPNHIDPYGHSIDLMMRWMPSADFNLGLQLAYIYRNERFWVKPYGYLDVTDLADYSFGLDTGVAVWYGAHTHTYVAVAVDGKFDHEIDDEFKTVKILPYVEFSLDLGSWFEHLAELRFVNRLGIGVSMYDFKYSTVPIYEDPDTMLMLESEISLNVVKHLNIDLIYRYRPDYSVGPVSAPSRLFNTVPVPGVGIFSVDLSFNLSHNWRAAFEANFGQNVDFWLGINKVF